MCAARDSVAHYYARDYAHHARVFGGISFGDLVKICQFAKIKIPAKVSGYMVPCSVPLLSSSDLQRRSLELEERKYLVGRGVVTETQSNMGKT